MLNNIGNPIMTVEFSYNVISIKGAQLINSCYEKQKVILVLTEIIDSEIFENN